LWISYLTVGGHPENWASETTLSGRIIGSMDEGFYGPQTAFPESIAAVLRRVEAGIPIAELARKAGVHENTIHLLKKKYGQLGAAEIREINELRDENTRLKRSSRI
jgi:hypothetical protein